MISKASTPAMGPTVTPVQWVLEALAQVLMCCGMKLTSHLHLVPRARVMDNYTSTLPYIFVPLRLNN
jgi:hypothetical protein